MNALRSLSIKTRLLVAFVFLAAFMAFQAAQGYSYIDSTIEKSRMAEHDERVMSAAKEMQYYFADMAGWQTGYSLEYNLKTPDALDDTKGISRKALLSSAGELEKRIEEMNSLAPTGEDGDLFAEVTRYYNEFRQIDDQIIAAYRSGTAANLARGNNLALVDSIERLTKANEALGKLAANVTEKSESGLAANISHGESTRKMTVTFSIIALVCSVLLGWLITQSIRKPLMVLDDNLRDIASGEGDLTRRLEATGKDELTSISENFNVFVEKLNGTIRQVGDSANTLASAAEELSVNSSHIAAASEETSVQAAVVAEAGNAVNSSVETVTTGASELGLSIREIAQNAAEAARVAANAVELAGATTDTVKRLGDSSAEISSVVQVINAVAAQTNLLALNATIEAARAGDAGKGFAVVAGEVKDLAQETAKATEDITRRIETIQTETSAAVSAIDEIGRVIAQINDYQGSIAGAVEEQTATASEMNRTVEQASVSTRDIVSNINGVASAAQSTTSSVSESQQAVAELSRMSNELQTIVAQFKVGA